MRFSSYNMEGRIKSKTKFINEGVAECFNSVKYNNHYMLNKHDIDIFEIWNNYDSYDRNYSNLADMFSTVLKEFSEVYEIMNKVVDIAIAHRDRNVISDMYRLFRKYNIIMGQVNTLNDKAQQMPTDFDKFDFNISKWGIKGVKL